MGDEELEMVRDYFGKIFKNCPKITLADPKDCEPGTSVIMIEDNGLSITSYPNEKQGLFPGQRYSICDHEGYETEVHRDLLQAITHTVSIYSKELVRRISTTR